MFEFKQHFKHKTCFKKSFLIFILDGEFLHLISLVKLRLCLSEGLEQREIQK